MQTHAHTLLTALYPGKSFRISLYPENIQSFKDLHFIDERIPFEKITVHKDPQGMVMAKKRDLRFIMDPLTGNFRLNGSKEEIISGAVQSGENSSNTIFIRLKPKETVYGFGCANGNPDRNNSRFKLMNRDTLLFSIPGSSYSSFPFFIIRNGKSFTGIFTASSIPMDIHVDSGGIGPSGAGINIKFENRKNKIPINLFVFQGSPKEIVENYIQLTGFPCRLPAWALGFHQSRWSYSSQQEVVDIADKFQKHDIPCDAIYLDIDYMDRFRNFTWNRNKFPSPDLMNKQLSNMGMRTVAIVDAAINKDHEFFIFNEGHEKKYFCRDLAGEDYTGRVWGGKSVFPDFTNAKTRDWWSKKHQILFENGVSGIWNDMNEPVLKLGKKYNPLREKIVHDLGSHFEFRNLYANFEAQASQNAFEIYRSEERPFILTRAGFSGMQKYAVMWTGDNHQSWKHLKENLHMVINLGLSGMPYSGADIGGFASGPGKLGLLLFRRKKELFARWMELGSLMPFFRAHSVKYSIRREPWLYGEEILHVCRKHIKRRYRLMHYIYNLMLESHRTGSPMVRPVFYEFPMTDISQCENQFMLGSSLFAVPVLNKNQQNISFFLPEGSWHEYETGQIYRGNAMYELKTSPGYYPLFVKEGSILPSGIPAHNALQSIKNSLMVEIYPAKSMEYTLYLDDGLSLKNDFMSILFKGNKKESGNITLSVEISKKGYTPDFKTFKIRLPLKYSNMIMGEKNIQGIHSDLSSEDRHFYMSSFELPLKSQSVEFVYEK